MNVTEIDNVFHCDCGFSWQRGKSGAHDCAVGLRAQRDQLAAENLNLKSLISDGCKWDGEQWVGLSAETPATDAWQREQMARGVELLANFAGIQYQGFSGDKATQRRWKGVVLLCTDFAAQLRNGEAV